MESVVYYPEKRKGQKYHDGKVPLLVSKHGEEFILVMR